jgi:hypothetical protein
MREGRAALFLAGPTTPAWAVAGSSTAWFPGAIAAGWVKFAGQNALSGALSCWFFPGNQPFFFWHVNCKLFQWAQSALFDY